MSLGNLLIRDSLLHSSELVRSRFPNEAFFWHKMVVDISITPGVATLIPFRTVVSKSLLVFLRMNWWSFIAQRGATWLERGYWKESINTICVQIRQGLYFVMSFLDPIGRNIFWTTVTIRSPLVLKFNSKEMSINSEECSLLKILIMQKQLIHKLCFLGMM